LLVHTPTGNPSANGFLDLAAIPLPMRLRVVMPVPDHRVAAASRATHALWPAVLAHQGEALRAVEQGWEVDGVHCGHDDRTLVFAGHR
jgi:hypothetical protein